MRLRRWLGIWAVLALVAPAVWFGLFFALGYVPGWGHDLVPFLWPTSIMLLLTAGREDTPKSYLIVAASILGNVTLYSFIGVAAWFLLHAFKTHFRQ